MLSDRQYQYPRQPHLIVTIGRRIAAVPPSLLLYYGSPDRKGNIFQEKNLTHFVYELQNEKKKSY